MVVGCWGPRQQGRTSSSDYVTPVTAAPVRGCTPDCLRKPVTGRHPSCGRGIPVSLPLLATRAYARGLQGYRRTTHPRSRHPRSRFAPALSPALARYRSSCRSSEADLPRGQTNPSINDDSAAPPRAPPPPSPSRPSYAATAITFAGKSSGAVRESGLTLQGADCAVLR